MRMASRTSGLLCPLTAGDVRSSRYQAGQFRCARTDSDSCCNSSRLHSESNLKFDPSKSCLEYY
jgi:hypothetical protein